VSPGRTRRQLLAGGIGAAVAGMAGLAATPAEGSAVPGSVSDGALLQQLVDASQMIVYGCQKCLGSGKLHQDAQAVLALLLTHEQAHLARLESTLQALRLPPPKTQPPPPSPQADVTNLFKDIRDEVVALQGMVQVGNLAQHAYFTAAGSFHDPGLALLAAEILAVEAQHWTLIEILLHKGDPTLAVPHPAVRGAKAISPPHIAAGAPG
jgi:hypothetical protein